MNKKLNFADCTIAASSNVISSQKAAEKLFKKKGYQGKVGLYRVLIAPKQERAFWVCMLNNKAIATLPVFRDEDPLPVGKTYPMENMVGYEMFPKDETFFRTYLNKDGEVGIRAVMIFPDEQLARKACQARGRNVITVQPVRLFDSETNKYLAAAWCMKCMDCDVEFSISFIDLRDGIVLDGYDFEKATYANIGAGERFLAYDTYYEMKKSSVGEWYITKSPMQVTLGGAYAK